MSIEKITVRIATGVVCISAAIALAGLLHALFTSHGLDELIHRLENWAVNLGYYIVLMLLATAGIRYLASKK